MRIGLIGLGRIGAFHAQTLSALPAVDSLVVTEADPAAIAAVAGKVGAEPAESPEALLKAGVDGIVIAAATHAQAALIRAGVEAGYEWPAGPPATFFMDRLAEAFRAELGVFTDVVAGTRVSPCTVDDALAVTWIAEAATRSVAEHRPIRIDDVRL